MEIVYVPYEKIDKEKWDECISNATYGSLYATAICLDTLAVKWDALVAGDYKTVMPLIYKKKAGIKYLYQPAFLPQTGIFSAEPIPGETISAFLKQAFTTFRFAEISLINPPGITCFDENMQLTLRNNFTVSLSDDYSVIAENYHPHFKKSLRRLKKHHLIYKTSDDVKEVIELYMKLYFKKVAGLKKSAVENFRFLCEKMQKQDKAIIRKVYDADKNLLATVILLIFRNRLYNLMSCITPAGKKAEANYFLYDNIIKEFSGRGKVLDLEGSDIKGIADFYLKMNPINEKYPFIKYNNLPGILKLFKK